MVVCIKEEQDLIKNVFSLYDYLENSGMLIVYSRNLEVFNLFIFFILKILIELDRIFFEGKLAIDCRIHETFLREYQVLPLRTHPNMNVKGYSGYVFSAVKIVEVAEEIKK